METRLPRSGFRIPLSRNIQVGNLRLQELVNDLAQKHDATVALLETSMRNSARTSFHFHMSAALLSAIAFVAQICRVVLTRQNIDRPWPAHARKSSAKGLSDDEAVVRFHNGSFPEGGYTL
jgi:hypothetical protein